MFGLKNLANNLQYSERFYYTNYEFYNDYESSTKYANDHTKIFYNCNRKTQSTIIKYKHINELVESRVIRSKMQVITLQSWLDSFIHTFEENNYSDFPDNREQCNKSNFKLKFFPSEEILFNRSTALLGKSKYNKQIVNAELITVVLDIQKEVISNIMSMNENDEIPNQQLDYFRYLLAFSEVMFGAIYGLLKCSTSGIYAVKKMNLFRLLIVDLIQKMLQEEAYSHLVLYVPNIPILNSLMNPALWIIKNYMLKCESVSKSEVFHQGFEQQIPKIAFLNLDGIQHPLNLQYLNALPTKSLFYVTIFMEKQSMDSNDCQFSDFFSKFLINLISESNQAESIKKQQTAFQGGCKVLAFPLNSSYVRTKCEENGREFVNLSGSSTQILFLFETCILEQLRNFNPNIVFISYNGKLKIEQPHFNEIIRRLTVLTNHRLILFPNFSSLFESEEQINELFKKQMQFRDEELLQFNSDEEDLVNMGQYLQNLLFFEIQDIRTNEFFNNLGMFMKIASGCYSLNQKRQIKSSEKYEIWQKQQYLQMLSQVNQFTYIHKYCPKIKSTSLAKLLNMQRDAFLKSNSKQAQFVYQYIEVAIDMIMNKTESLPPYLKILSQRVLFKYDGDRRKLIGYLENKKKSIAVQYISRQKIRKVYALNSKSLNNTLDEIKSKNVIAYSLFFNGAKNEKLPIFLQNFSQVFIQPTTGFVFCSNCLTSDYKILYGYGWIDNDSQEVLITPMQIKNMLEVTHLHLSFSSYFDTKNGLLYLYWPLDWDIVQEALCQLLEQVYQPRLSNNFWVVEYGPELKCELTENNFYMLTPKHKVQVLPRIGSTMWALNESQLFIFGGFFNNQNDFFAQGSPVSILRREKAEYEFQTLSKQKLSTRLRPKSNYTIERVSQNLLLIRGGYGRQFTNYYNIYSYMQYYFDLSNYMLTSQTTDRQISPLSCSISNNERKKFIKGENRSDVCSIENTKHRFIIQNGRSVVSFIDDQYSVKAYRQQGKYFDIFELNKSLKCIYRNGLRSPQIYIQKKSSSQITRIQLVRNINVNNRQKPYQKYVMPNEDSIVSMCIDKRGVFLYLMVEKPKQFEEGQQFMIYKGNLKQLVDITGFDKSSVKPQKCLQLTQLYQLDKYHKKLGKKTLCYTDNRLLILGGQQTSPNFRQDYIIEQTRGVNHLKIISLSFNSLEQADNSQILQMNKSLIVQDKTGHFFSYALQFNEQREKWTVKIENFSLTSNDHSISVSELTICTIIDSKMHQIQSVFTQPCFVSISKLVSDPIQILKHYFQKLQNSLQLDSKSNISFVEDIRYLKNKISLFQLSQEQTRQSLDSIYDLLIDYSRFMQQRFYIYESHEQIVMLLNQIVSFVADLRVTDICLRFIDQWEGKELYKFYIQEEKNNLVKYLAVNQLGSHNLVFFRLKFERKTCIKIKSYGPESSLVYGFYAGPSLNRIQYRNESFAKKLLKQGEESFLEIQQISPFQQEKEVYQINSHIDN